MIYGPGNIYIWHSNSVHNYVPQKLQSVNMDMRVHCCQFQCIARDVRACVHQSYNKLVITQASLVPHVQLLAR